LAENKILRERFRGKNGSPSFFKHSLYDIPSDDRTRPLISGARWVASWANESVVNYLIGCLVGHADNGIRRPFDIHAAVSGTRDLDVIAFDNVIAGAAVLGMCHNGDPVMP